MRAFFVDEEDGNFVLCQPLDEAKWSALYSEHILDTQHCSNEKCTAHSDDMLWYVPLVKISATPSASYVGAGVRRRA